jgi:hypothetical protein
MTDLISSVENTPENLMNVLLSRFAPVIELFPKQKNSKTLAFIFEISVNYIKEKYPNLNPDWKTWTVTAVQKMYFDNKINTVEDIILIIDDFIGFTATDYQIYSETFKISQDEFEINLGFVNYYIKIKSVAV